MDPTNFREQESSLDGSILTAVYRILIGGKPGYVCFKVDLSHLDGFEHSQILYNRPRLTLTFNGGIIETKRFVGDFKP